MGTSISTTCRSCGREYVADRAAIVGGQWQFCPECRPAAAASAAQAASGRPPATAPMGCTIGGISASVQGIGRPAGPLGRPLPDPSAEGAEMAREAFIANAKAELRRRQ